MKPTFLVRCEQCAETCHVWSLPEVCPRCYGPLVAWTPPPVPQVVQGAMFGGAT